MLYNKSRVISPIPITGEQHFWMRSMDPFKLPDTATSPIEDYYQKKSLKPLEVLASLANHIKQCISYDFKHEYEGARTAGKAIVDEKGHCVEQNTALYAIASRLLPSYRSNMSWLIAKNPRGYDSKPLVEVGIHPFLCFSYKEKEYLVDATGGTLEEFKPLGFALTTEKLSNREFIAISLLYGGEDLGLVHNKPKIALNWLGAAQRIDPNNYTVDITGAWMFNLLNEDVNAERAHIQAIRIAPHALEPYIMYADFLSQFKSRTDRAVQTYEVALSKETNDAQMLSHLENALASLGAHSLRRKARRKLEKLLQTPHYKKYFSRN